jgi:hypothetical protein
LSLVMLLYIKKEILKKKKKTFSQETSTIIFYGLLEIWKRNGPVV